MRELYTTPIPMVGEVWKYYVEDGRIEVPERFKKQTTEIFYLHFLYFKKNKYRVLDNFWKNDFYQIEKGLDVGSVNGVIEISNQFIRWKDK